MNKSKHELDAWEMMLEAKDRLGMPALERIFRVGHHTLYKQMRNPDLEGESMRPVIQRVRILLHDLAHVGGAPGRELAHAMLDYMASALDMHGAPNADAKPDHDDIRAECLDDYPEVVLLHRLIEDGADLRSVEAQAGQVKREIDETVTAYRREIEGEA